MFDDFLTFYKKYVKIFIEIKEKQIPETNEEATQIVFSFVRSTEKDQHIKTKKIIIKGEKYYV